MYLCYGRGKGGGCQQVAEGVHPSGDLNIRCVREIILLSQKPNKTVRQ